MDRLMDIGQSFMKEKMNRNIQKQNTNIKTFVKVIFIYLYCR